MSERFCPTCDQVFGAALLRCPNDGAQLLTLSARPDLVGQIIDERYEITAHLGDGGMGSVYRARQIHLAKDVALKLIAPRLIHAPSIARRFVREARLSGRIEHPTIVSATDFGQTADGQYFLVTRFVPGETLKSALSREGAFARERAVRIAIQLCDALEAAHAAQVIHRDLKPANIMLSATPQGAERVHVLDFGIARSLSDDSETPLTQDGAVVGTGAYMPPEQALARPLDARTDLYALGCILYEMLGGRPPFAKVRTLAALILHHVRVEPAPLPPNVPPVLANLTRRLLAKAPDARPPTAAATRAALEAALEASLDFVPPRSPPAPLDSPAVLVDTVEPSIPTPLVAGATLTQSAAPPIDASRITPTPAPPLADTAGTPAAPRIALLWIGAIFALAAGGIWLMLDSATPADPPLIAPTPSSAAGLTPGHQTRGERAIGQPSAAAEAALTDGALTDAAPGDAAPIDAALVDAALVDAALVDAAPIDAASLDAGSVADAQPIPPAAGSRRPRSRRPRPRPSAPPRARPRPGPSRPVEADERAAEQAIELAIPVD